MGFSVKWARTNLGAESEENLGDDFSWGATTPKEIFFMIYLTHFNHPYVYKVVIGRVVPAWFGKLIME